MSILRGRSGYRQKDNGGEGTPDNNSQKHRIFRQIQDGPTGWVGNPEHKQKVSQIRGQMEAECTYLAKIQIPQLIIHSSILESLA